MQGKTSDAIGWYEKATRFCDKDADAWAFLGDLCEERKEYGKAAGCFRKLLEAKTDEPTYSEKLKNSMVCFKGELGQRATQYSAQSE